jgi:anti-anti-sigma factor
MHTFKESAPRATIVHKDCKAYRIFSLLDDLTLNSDITELAELVDRAVASGIRNIALVFTRDSYLSTRTISVLVNCFEAVKDVQGNLAIIGPNEDILDVLGMIDIDRMVRFYPSEEKLVEEGSPAAALA